MVDVVSPALAIRSSVGIQLWVSPGPMLPYENQPHLDEQTKSSRSINFSPDGSFFAFSNGLEVRVLRTADWELQCSLPRPKAFYLEFSPKGTYLCTWELYTVSKDKKDGVPNMYVYEILTGKEVFAVVQKSQTDWKPSWSTDESIFALVVGKEAIFYNLEEGSKGFISPIRKLAGSRGAVLSIGPGNSPPYIAYCTSSGKDSPSMCKLYKYPGLSQNQSLACKSFFQADRIEVLWNKRGTGALLLTSTEVDKSGASYYGNQALHFIGTKGDSCSVPLSKEGPVHCVKWSPKVTEFIVVYGLMPSKAAVYNLKCDVIFDFGEGPRNCAYFNAFGNLVVLAGFGNLPGNIEIWDMNTKERLNNIKVPDTTYFEWSPNGEYFVTATTAPRLRIGNGFKVYHYSGALMHETIWPENQELLEIKWQRFPENTFMEPTITKKKQEGIKSSQPEASMKAYTPPHLRLLKEGKDPKKYLPQPKAASPGPLTDKKFVSKVHASKKSGGNKHNCYQSGNGISKINNERTNEEANEKKKTANAVSDASIQSEQHLSHTPHNQKKQHVQKTQLKVQCEPGMGRNSKFSERETNFASNDYDIEQAQNRSEIPKGKIASSEKEKKIRNVAKKLSEIKKLKSRQNQGETLELNQLSKISQEAKFLEELKTLKMST